MQTGKIYSPPSVFLAELTRGNIIVPTRNLLTGKVASLLTVANGPNIFPGVILLNFYTSFQRRGKKNIGKIDSCEHICICIYRARVSKFYIQKWELSVLLHRLNLIRIDDNEPIIRGCNLINYRTFLRHLYIYNHRIRRIESKAFLSQRIACVYQTKAQWCHSIGV